MAAPVLYRSTDSSAPTLSGTAGSLVALLDACLVTGYGSKAAAGWTKPYTGTNGAVFRQAGGCQFYWQVDDNGPGAAVAREARTRGYEVMTAWNTGTGLFPTAAQLAAGIIVRKSTTADATARAWVVAADDRTVTLFLSTGDTANTYLCTYFGEIMSVMAGDNYKCGLMGRHTENSATAATTGENFGTLRSNTSAQNGHYLARDYTNLGSSVNCAKHSDGSKMVTSAQDYVWAGTRPFPNPADGALYMGELIIVEAAALNSIRGKLRGLRASCHAGTSFADADTFDGMGAEAGNSFQIVKSLGGTAGSTGFAIVETTEWATSS